MNDIFAIIYAGESNPRLRELIEYRSVAALPIGGRYRAIDFPLSNLANSGINTVGLITQRNYKSLMDHIGSGKDWDLSKKNGGLLFLPPYDLGGDSGLYHDSCDALFSKRDYIEIVPRRYCLLLGSHTIYRQDYNRLYEEHMASGADITMLVCKDPHHEDGDPYKKVNVDVDDQGWVTGIDFESFHAKSDLIGLDAYLMDKTLLTRLIEDACSEGRYNFVTDVLRENLAKLKENFTKLKVRAVMHEGYTGRLISVKSYFDVSMDMIDSQVRNDLFLAGAPIYTKIKDEPPVRFMGDCHVAHSILGNGCEIYGSVENSVLFRGVYVAPGAEVRNCVIMQNTHIGARCTLRNVIIDKDGIIKNGARVIATPDNPTVMRKRVTVDGRGNV